MEDDQSDCSEDVIFTAVPSPSSDVVSKSINTDSGPDQPRSGDILAGGTASEAESDTELDTSEGTPLINGISCDQSRHSDWSTGQETQL